MKKFIFLLFIGFILWGCGHTNELHNFQVAGSKIYFEETVGPEAAYLTININSGQEKKGESKLLDVLTSVGSELMTSDKRNKIKEAVNTSEIVQGVSVGLENALVNYLNVVPTDKPGGETQFISETELQRCVLNVNQNSVTLDVKVNSRIIEKATGMIVWENWEQEFVPINYSYKKDSQGAEAKLLTALQLSNLSENEIAETLFRAVQSIGKKMAETFREDLAESKKKANK